MIRVEPAEGQRRDDLDPHHAHARHGVSVVDLLRADLLPAAPATDFRAQATAEAAKPDDSIPAALRTLPTVLRAGDDGKLGRVSLGEQDIQGMEALRKELNVILKDPTLPFDQTVIKVDPNLRYEELMQVIDVFSSLKVNKISFEELGPDDGA